jgi:hypothetical protein
MRRPKPRSSPLLSRPPPPKVAPVPVAATASPPSILSLAHVLGLVFASFFLLSSSFLLSALSRTPLAPTLAVHHSTSSYPLLPQTHIHWLSHESRQSQQLLIIPRSVRTSINESITPSSAPSPPQPRTRRRSSLHCHHPPCDTPPNMTTCACQTLHQPAPIANRRSYKAFLPCPN